jgi:Flp pilus assembly protein CpaB
MTPPVAPSSPTRTLRRLLRRVRRAILARRRVLAALLTGLAVAAALQAHAAPPPELVPVVVASRDLPPGATVTAADLHRVGFAPGSVPAGVVAPAAAVGRMTVGPVRAGEPLTDVRLLDEGLLARYPGAVAAPVRIGDAGSVDLLRVGDRVSVLAADPQGSGAAVEVVDTAPVLAVPRTWGSDPALSSGALVVLALDPVTAQEVAGAAARAFLSVVVVR